jgi:hypothetical protein
LKDQPLIHAVVGTSQDVFSQPFPSLWDGFHPCLLET